MYVIKYVITDNPAQDRFYSSKTLPYPLIQDLGNLHAITEPLLNRYALTK